MSTAIMAKINHPLAISFLIGGAVFLAACCLWSWGFFQPAELWVYDTLVKLRSDPKATDPRIIIVSLDEKDIQRYDWPLHDSLLAKLLQNIERDQPRSIGLDIYRDLPEPRDGSQLGDFNRVLSQYPNIVCIFKYGDEKQPIMIAPPDILGNSPDQVAFNDFTFDYKTVRRGFLFEPNNCQYQSLAWALTRWYVYPLGIVPETTKEGLTKLGKTTFDRFGANDGGYVGAFNGGYQMLMDFKGPQTFTTKSIGDVLGTHAAGLFKDKVVLIGSTAESLGDFLITPLNEHESGVILHAQLVNQLLRAALDGDHPTYSWNTPTEVAWVFGWSMLATALGYFCHSPTTFGAALIGMLISLGLVTVVAFFHGVWLLSAVPASAVLGAAANVKVYLVQMEARQRAVLMRLFSQQVSGEVAQSMWEQRDQFMDGNRPRAQKLVATFLFTDLKDYSAVTEKLEPDVLMGWIDEYLGALGAHVAKNGGIVNKFIGDAIMAIFGAPIPRTTDREIRQDAVNAVLCALAMKNEIQLLNSQWKTRGLPEAGMRIGIHTGTVMGGYVGHVDRLEYTTIGDATNTAARLESVEKDNTTLADGDCRILIGETTFELVKDRFATELMGKIKLKGQNKTTVVYRILRTI